MLAVCSSAAPIAAAKTPAGPHFMTKSNSNNVSARFATLDDYLAHLEKGGGMDPGLLPPVAGWPLSVDCGARLEPETAVFLTRRAAAKLER